MQRVQSITLFLLLFFTIQQTKAFCTSDTLHIAFNNMVGEEKMELNKTYTNVFNESFTIRVFKYYISNIRLADAAGKTLYSNEDIFLINEAEEASKHIAIAVPEIKFSTIQFLLGVDSIHNNGGVQTGSLDPAKGMFWVWNTGYIMAKMEGNSPAAKVPGHIFTYDIGGYKQSENAARAITLNMPEQDAFSAITIFANAAAWFKSYADIRIAENPACHAAGALATKIADNYATMFSIAAPVR